mmetsp:Transcript_52105/g.124121  ORF Transcript_52105/g.124121 Transcript_52105/m.124121 type:complete len:239 (-) Transcript_52105:89-805(-)
MRALGRGGGVLFRHGKTAAPARHPLHGGRGVGRGGLHDNSDRNRGAALVGPLAHVERDPLPLCRRLRRQRIRRDGKAGTSDRSGSRGSAEPPSHAHRHPTRLHGGQDRAWRWGQRPPLRPQGRECGSGAARLAHVACQPPCDHPHWPPGRRAGDIRGGGAAEEARLRRWDGMHRYRWGHLPPWGDASGGVARPSVDCLSLLPEGERERRLELRVPLQAVEGLSALGLSTSQHPGTVNG